jgi:hypothetical protein
MNTSQPPNPEGRSVNIVSWVLCIVGAVLGIWLGGFFALGLGLGEFDFYCSIAFTIWAFLGLPCHDRIASEDIPVSMEPGYE